MTPARRLTAAVAGLMMLAATLSVVIFELWAPGHVIKAFLTPDPFSLPEILVRQVLAPRILVALLAGAALAMSAFILQHVLRNPLASPTTFGISSGAIFVVTLSALAAPQLPRVAGALVGGGLAATGATILAARRRLTPLALTVAGLFVALLFGAGTTVLQLLQGMQLGGVAIWGAGSLEGQGSNAMLPLVLAVTTGVLIMPLLLRPLKLLQVDDRVAGSLGVSVVLTRLGGLALVIWLSGAAAATVGGIGFIDLAAVAAVRFAKVRNGNLVYTALIGAGLLWLVDEVAQLLSIGVGVLIPTGSIAGLLGAPVMIFAARFASESPLATISGQRWREAETGSPIRTGLLLAVVLIGGVIVSLTLGRAIQGWHWSVGQDFWAMLRWRGPRVGAAVAAGILLALAGSMIQRLTANPMASPELLGVTTAAALVNVLILALAPESSRLTLLVGGGLAAATLIFALLRIGRHRSFDASTFLLAGVGLSAVLGAAINLVLAFNMPDSGRILAWLGGSTYGLTSTDALLAGAFAGIALIATPLIVRWLDILPLGPPYSIALGLDVARTRFLLILMTAILTAAGTLIVGPFAFIGLLAPHLAALCGARRAAWQLPVSAVFGALILMLADFVGRNLLFPYQLPAGTMATALGMGPMIWLLLRR